MTIFDTLKKLGQEDREAGMTEPRILDTHYLEGFGSPLAEQIEPPRLRDGYITGARDPVNAEPLRVPGVPKRYAIVSGARTRSEVEAYLPSNYIVIHEYESADSRLYPTKFVIAGRDNAGWTLDDYVIPRLGSGSLGCTEIDLSHPIMEEVPA